MLLDPSMVDAHASWDALEKYRERYGVDSSPTPDLRAAARRREMRAQALQRRVDQLETELAETRQQLERARDEVVATRRTAGMVADQLIHEMRQEHNEAWSPVAVLGFRLWVIRESGLFGYRTHWRTPHVTALCLNQVRGDDLPHSSDRCGPPACGIYATKDFHFLLREAGVTDVAGYAFGVVALTGKVIEHDHGYRAATAEVRAISLFADGLRLETHQPGEIDRLFTSPVDVLRLDGIRAEPDDADAERFLCEWKEKQQWT